MSQEGDEFMQNGLSRLSQHRDVIVRGKNWLFKVHRSEKSALCIPRAMSFVAETRQNNGRSKVRELCVGVVLSLAARNIFIAVSLFSAREIRWNRARVPYKSPDAMNMEYWSHDINGNSISGWLSERMIKVSIFLRSWIFNIDGHTTFSDSCYSTLR